MKWVESFFRLSLWLYPGRFRRRFADEMRDVFHDRLVQAQAQHAVAPFLLRELVQLPVSLADVYAWALSGQEEGQLALSGASASEVATGAGGRPDGWCAALLAGLPHLLFGLLLSLPLLLKAAGPGGEIISSAVVGRLAIIPLGLVALAVLVYGLRKGWPRWSASWLLYIVLIPAQLVILGVMAGISRTSPASALEPWVQGILQGSLLLCACYLLYKIACASPLRGLLAAIPLATILWSIFQELVPDLLRGLANVVAWLLAFTAAVLILRTRRIVLALGLAFAANALGGLLSVYLSVFHLEVTPPGGLADASWSAVVRQFVPFFGITSAILLGPQLAAQLRVLGREARLEGGQAFARLALAGPLLALLVGMLGVFTSFTLWNAKVYIGLLAAAGIVYAVGLALLVRALLRSGVVLADAKAARRLSLLAMVLPGVPLSLILVLAWTEFAGILAWAAILAIIPGWILLSAYVVVLRG